VTDFDVLGKDGAAQAAFAGGSSAKAVAAAVNADSSSTGVTAQAVTIARISLDAEPDGLVTFSINGGGTETAISETVTSNTDLTNIKNAINSAAGSTGVTADFYGSDKSYLVLTDADGDDIFLSNFSDTGTTTNLNVSVGNFDGTSFSAATTVASLATGANDAVVNGVVRMESTQAFSISGEESGNSPTTGATGYLGNTNASASSSATNVSGIDVSTEAGARSAISVLDGALEAVNETRSELGATSNRLEYTINNLNSMVTNAGASKSRIEDADFAVETSNLTKAQILSQAATAMLAQANASKQSVLSLLQG
jgi:flagellin